MRNTNIFPALSQNQPSIVSFGNQVIINLKRTPKGYSVIETQADSATVISFPKNVVYGNIASAPPRRGRHPLNRNKDGEIIHVSSKKIEDFSVNGQHLKNRKQIETLNSAFQRPENKLLNLQRFPQTRPENTQNEVHTSQIQPKQPLNYKEQFLKQFSSMVPATTRWFNFNSIHPIEKDALPEFFGEGASYSFQTIKNARTYIKQRNQIIKKWHKNPKTHLKLTECLQVMQGDAASITRIFAFLEHWGLINFSISINQIGSGNYLQRNQNIWERFKLNQNSEEPQSVPQNIEIFCTNCNKSVKQLYVQKEDTMANFQKSIIKICENCFNEYIFPSYLKAEDFVEEKICSPIEEPWKEEETLRLLESIMKYQENWNEIKKQFPNRTVETIIHQYLKLPFFKLSEISIIDETELHPEQKPKGDLIYNFSRDESNPILKYIGTFKISLDKMENQKIQTKCELAESKQELLAQDDEQEQVLQKMVDLQLQKIDSTLLFLEDFEKNIHQEKINLNDIKRQNILMLLEKDIFPEEI